MQQHSPLNSPIKNQVKHIRNNSTTLYTIKVKSRNRPSTPHKKTTINQQQLLPNQSNNNPNAVDNQKNTLKHTPIIKNIKNTQSASLSNLLKKIPKTVVLDSSKNQLIELCFSYIDQGLEKWKIGKIIGRGNSSVREAMNIKNGLRAAVKQVVLQADDQQQKMKQIQILQKLQHPNIVRYYQHYKVKGETWIFMELVEINLRKFYQQYGIPPANVILAFTKQIVEALAYLKSMKVIHKDIKCQNILLDNGVLKLCDFGCSKDFRNTISLKLYEKNPPVKAPKGSYLWAAPQCHKYAKFSFASDIWSLGCTLCQLMSGGFPWSQIQFQNQIQVMKHIADSSQIPYIDENWDSRIKQIIKGCLQRQAEERVSVEQLLSRQHLWK